MSPILSRLTFQNLMTHGPIQEAWLSYGKNAAGRSMNVVVEHADGFAAHGGAAAVADQILLRGANGRVMRNPAQIKVVAGAVLAESRRVATLPGQLVEGWANSDVGKLLAMLGERLKTSLKP
ncbi:MAG: hypothetical protein JWM80_2129 [Cyanobacteria bacterium RYN_339]|nr:hypothetical protein [Cyanobacteria bacterium RYN_339]